MKKTLIALCALAITSSTFAAAGEEWSLKKGNVLVMNGLSRGGAPKSTLQAIKAAIKGGWGLCCDVSLLDDGGVFLVDSGVISRIAAYNEGVNSLSSDKVKGLNLNENSGGEFDDLDMDFYGPCELEKIAPLIPGAGTVMFRFTNGLGTTEKTAAEIKKRMTGVFGGKIPTNIVFASGHLNMLIDLRREMPDANIWWYIWPCAKKTGALHPGTMPKPLASQIKKHKFNGIVVMFAAGQTTEEYYRQISAEGVRTGSVAGNHDISPSFAEDSLLTYPIVTNPSSYSKFLRKKGIK